MINEHKAIGFTLGSLSPLARSVVARERLYNQDLDNDINELEQVYSTLNSEDKNLPAPADIWQRIEHMVEEENQDLGDKTVAEFMSGDWQKHGEGIDFKLLWSDSVTMIRCAPGGIEEEHDQPKDANEHIIVVAGDLMIGNRKFGTGDYICIPAGTVHARMSSPNGCILFTEYSC